MLLILLLQSVTSKTITISEGALPVVYGSIIAGALGVIGSITAALITSRRAVKAAGLSAGATRDAARMAAENAQVLKDKDYKHEVYKKILDKRIVAWEKAEQLTALLLTTKFDAADRREFPSFFLTRQTFKQVTDKAKEVNGQVSWLEKDFAIHLTNFYQLIIELKNSCITLNTPKDPNGEFIIDDMSFREAGKRGLSQCNILIYKILHSLSRTLSQLHDIESFYKSLNEMGGPGNAPQPKAPSK